MDYHKILMAVTNDRNKPGTSPMESLINHLGTNDMKAIDNFITWCIAKGYFLLVRELRNDEGE